MISRTMVRSSLVVALCCVAGGKSASHAQTVLVGDAFLTGNTGWVDAFHEAHRLPKWRMNLHLPSPTLMDTNNQNPPISGATTNAGTYEPDVLVKTGVLAPSSYEYSAMMRSSDDDIFGLVWNYQDPNNYFRVGVRQQNAGSFGGTKGLAIQKIVGGVLTQISPNGTGEGAVSPISQTQINTRELFEFKVVVDGQDYEVFFNDTSIVTGNDADLEADRMIGFQSWAQQTDSGTVTRSWGTEVESVSLSETSAGGPYSESFNSTPVKWRNVTMTNSAGISIPTNGVVAGSTTAAMEDVGNFGQSLIHPWILQDSNGFENATAGNVDFIGPAIALDEPDSANFSDYRMNVRLGSMDNDGYGILVRVQDDNNFYRVTFHQDPASIGTTRPPRGMSIQKVRNGVWSELHRDNEVAIPFLPPAATVLDPSSNLLDPSTGLPMFDVIVRALGDTLSVRVIDGNGDVIDYGSFQDLNDPILTGTVGLHSWGSVDSYYMGYGGGDGPLLVAIPEPASIALALLAGLGLLAVRRRHRA